MRIHLVPAVAAFAAVLYAGDIVRVMAEAAKERPPITFYYAGKIVAKEADSITLTHINTKRNDTKTVYKVTDQTQVEIGKQDKPTDPPKYVAAKYEDLKVGDHVSVRFEKKSMVAVLIRIQTGPGTPRN